MEFVVFFQAEDGIRDFCLSRGLAAELREQAEQSRPVTGGTYFDQVSADSSLFLTFVVSPDLSRNWKLMPPLPSWSFCR